MTDRLLSFARLAPVWIAGAVILLLASACDTTEETITLNDSANPTTVTYRFEYNPQNAVGGSVSTVSVSADNLGEIIEEYGYSRSDVVSARVSSATLVRVSSRQSAPEKVEKVFDYVEDVSVYAGASDGGPVLVPTQTVSPNTQVQLNTENTEVTSTVSSGPSRAFIVVDVQNVPSDRTVDIVEVEVDFTIEVRA